MNSWFAVPFTHLWEEGRTCFAETGRITPTVDKGKSYIASLNTEPWIARREMRFTFDVMYMNVRRPANQWFDVFPVYGRVDFYVPVSEQESRTHTYCIRLTATNGAPWRPEVNRLNWTRRASDFAAANQIHMTYNVQVIGWLGGFVIENTNDPHWEAYFNSHYIGSSVNVHNRPSNESRWHDLFNTIPNLRRSPQSTQPIVGINNGANNAIKLGYAIPWSVQSMGNYTGGNLEVTAQYMAINVRTGERLAPDLFYLESNQWISLSNSTNYITSHYLADPLLKIANPEHSNSMLHSTRNKLTTTNRTQISNNIGGYTIPFNHLGTHVGSQFLGTIFTGVTGPGPNLPNRNEHNIWHIEQAQRWHGVHQLPNTTVAVRPGQTPNPDRSNLLQRDWVLVVEFVFDLQGPAWHLRVDEPLHPVGTARIRLRDRSSPPGSPPTQDWWEIPNLPPATVIIYDLTLNSTDDLVTGGTH
jgi:hypothetical protein